MSNENNALLGDGSEFEGKLSFEGSVRIDGRFTGEIHSAGTLIIGETARVHAEIRVAQVQVYGEVVGNIVATERVELHAPAQLRGNITSPALHIDNGVFFDGNCQMSTGTSSQPVQPSTEHHQGAAPQHAPAPVTPARPSARTSQATQAISGLFQPESVTPRTELKHSF